MSSGTNQRTLFQTWGAAVPQNKVVPPKKGAKKSAGRHKPGPSNNAGVVPVHPPRNPLWTEVGQGSAYTSGNPGRADDAIAAFEDGDDDDDLMVVAVYEAERSLELDNANVVQADDPVNTGSGALSPTPSAGRTYADFPGFDSSSARVWIYPTNYPIRGYQLKMSEAALFQNTLVCLPTGLGKTFIASVVMYNFYRWYPTGKIVFMAPTKPLVSQQIEACYKVMGIPQEHMAELTGSTVARQRQEVWRSKRVFFLTPQVMVNDLSRDTCPAQQVKCVVIDEAHKALGNHAYCQVVRQLSSQTLQFRILALSATPGGDTKSVQSVISNLLISHIELRSEESPDILAHSHQRSVEKVVVPLGEALSAYQARYLQVLEKFISRLVQNRVMGHKDLRTLTKYQLILARDQFRKNPPAHIQGLQQGMLEGDFALCISLYHGYELLMQMGLRSLFFYIQGIMDGSREMTRARNELQRTPSFMDLYSDMEKTFVKPSAGPDEPFNYSHPKLEKLEEVVLQHFRLWAESSANNNGPQAVSTRVMIFSSFRESVQEIAAMLNHHTPLIRVMTFMGQASAGKGVKGFTQKEQLEVVHRFRQGGFNTLVSTCVGEEGLDIGEVDLIVCFDAQKNPIRLVQRMGRTGRKRQGRIVVILAEGREERTYNQSQSNKRSIYKAIISNKSGFHMFPNSPRMLPEGVNPTLHKMHITCGQFDHRESSRRSSRGRRSHCDGRASLIHPQNLIRQGSATLDGFLSSTEYSVWASTMRLKEDEAHPTLKDSHFMSLPSDRPLQVSGAASRELSLWEWRHWQHKAFPTHAVAHSLRCQHFIKVMELIDGMREENEGECRYERELLPYLSRADGVDHVKNPKKTKKGTKDCTKSTAIKPRASRPPDLEVGEDSEWDQPRTMSCASSSSVTKQRPPAGHDPNGRFDDVADHPGPEAVCSDASKSDGSDLADDCGVSNEHVTDCAVSALVNLHKDSQLITHIDEDVELQAMFYLPKWDSTAPPLPSKPHPGTDEGLKVILANVAELLSRSPPPLISDFGAEVAPVLPPPSPQQLHQPFHVSFTLDVDDDGDDVMMGDADSAPSRAEPSESLEDTEYSTMCRTRPRQEPEPVSKAADSPTWDEVFESEERDDGDVREDDGVKDDGVCEIGPRMDESMDLFEDDEAFLQMTIPDISTPDRSCARAGDTSNSTKMMSNSQLCNTKHPDSTHNLNTMQTDELACTYQLTNNSNAKLNTSKSHCKSLTMQQHDNSCDLFSVNFDLGYSLEDSEDEAKAEAVSVPSMLTSPPSATANTTASLPPVTHSSTPNISRLRVPSQRHESKQWTPQMLSGLRKRETSGLTSPSTSKDGGLPSPIASPGARRVLMPGPASPHTASLSTLKRRPIGSCTTRAEGRSDVENQPRQKVCASDAPSRTVGCDSDSEDEVVGVKRRRQNKVNVLSTPDVSKFSSDVDSPVVMTKKRVAALNTSDETEAGVLSDNDFQNDSVFTRGTKAQGAERQRGHEGRAKRTKCKRVHQFLDEEAELSADEEGDDVSSDEEDGEDQNQSLEGFVVDNMHISQGLDDSEMHGIYLKSVRSPAVHGKFKMSYRNHDNMNVFSQVPEMDETYAEDSFVVGSEVEEAESSEEEAEVIKLMPEDSYVDGRRQYATRRRVFLHKAKSRTEAPPEQRAGAKAKRNRIKRVDDSSEEETEGSRKKSALGTGASDSVSLQPKVVQPEPSGVQQQQKAPRSSSSTLASKVSSLSEAQRREQRHERWRQRSENQHLLSDELDFEESGSSSKKLPQAPPAASSVPRHPASIRQDVPVTESSAPPASVCILADSRCISTGVELLTCLRRRHAATVHVCSLDGSYFIVSSRMAVERCSQSHLAASQNRKRLAERMTSLQGLFERICLIVEKDRSKPGEASRPFQRTRYYDTTLAALVRTGVRLLWSHSAEDSAGLLADLARLEQRKGQGIAVPLEVKGQHRQQALQMYLGLPSVNYAHALNLSHNFRSVAQLINSSIEDIQKGGCMGRSRAEEVYRFLRYSCDSFLISTKTKNN
ncbi:Fanconi anemia group M protein isoform X2 [Betta splendens]|uniref:ATP-dependent RNA helicase FANCM n=1 Tax=Betta splendens TaxID=158456 RepID=A0A6P7LN65_BETSP|nr:Fanconi anemia group M protein isoform X2 [Betta splendens]